MFELSDTEFESLRYQFGTSNRGGRRYRPYAFTEQGSDAVQRSAERAPCDSQRRDRRIRYDSRTHGAYAGKDTAQAVFIPDRDGVVRAEHRLGPNAPLPSASDLIRALQNP